MFSCNAVMLERGYAPAGMVAKKLRKALSTVHRMVQDGRVDGCADGRALYVRIESLIEHYRDGGNAALEAASRELIADCKAELGKPSGTRLTDVEDAEVKAK